MSLLCPDSGDYHWTPTTKMKKKQNNPVHASALQIALALVLISIAGILFASRFGQGDGSPANIITVTNTNDSGPGSLRAALAAANDFDIIDATGVSGTILLTSGELQITAM